MLPDFNRLKIFYYIYSSQSIVAAAKELNITQSAISQHLKKLEHEIKTPLFIRLHKQLVPTNEAHRLFNILSPFLDELETGLRSIKEGKVKPSGMLRIGSPVEFGKAFMPEIFALFRKKYPDVSFFLELGDPDIVLPMLRKGELDFALADAFLFHGDLGIYNIETIIDEEVILAVSGKYYKDVLKKDMSFNNLIDKEFISYSHNSQVLKSWFRHHFKKISVKLNIVMIVDSVQAVIAGINSHICMGIIPSYLVYEDIENKNIIPVTTKKKTIINKISLVQLQDKIPNLTEKLFLSHFKDKMGNTEVLKKFSEII